MKKFTFWRTSSYAMVAAAALLAFSSCGKDEPKGPSGPNTPEVTSFTPVEGGANTTLTITGKNFSTTLDENIVKINGVELTVTSATATQIVATVPSNVACNGQVEVTIGDDVVNSEEYFTYLSAKHIVYIAGYMENEDSGRLQAGFWKKDEAGTTYFPVVDANTSAVANAVYAEPNGKVHVVGYRASTGSYGSRAMYWRVAADGTIETSLELTTGQGIGAAGGTVKYDGEGKSVFVAPNGDVYVCGYEQVEKYRNASGTGTIDKRYAAKVWKNGTLLYTLAEPSNGNTVASEATAIGMIGSDLYVAGYKDNAKVTLWKNGQAEYELTNGDSDITFIRMSISHSNVYVASDPAPTDQAPATPMYWKNDESPIWITDGAIFATLTGIFAKNNVVYSSVDGDNQGGDSTPRYYVGNTAHTLPYEGTYARTDGGVWVAGKDIYVAGYEFDDDAFNYKVLYWKNGVKNVLLAESNDVAVNAIFVLEKD